MKKFKLYLHLLAQILAQTAVVELVPNNQAKYFAALVAVVGVAVAFFDTSAA